MAKQSSQFMDALARKEQWQKNGKNPKNKKSQQRIRKAKRRQM